MANTRRKASSGMREYDGSLLYLRSHTLDAFCRFESYPVHKSETCMRCEAEKARENEKVHLQTKQRIRTTVLRAESVVGNAGGNRGNGGGGMSNRSEKVYLSLRSDMQTSYRARIFRLEVENAALTARAEKAEAARDALRCCGNCKDGRKICANNPFDICDGWEAEK